MSKENKSATLLDKRVVERNIKKGLLTREEHDKHLQALPDVAESAEKIQAKLGVEDDIDDDEDELDDEEDAGEEAPGDAG